MKTKRRASRMETDSRPESELAFTRLELLSVVAATGLLACVFTPALANNGFGVERAICENNLRLLGRALQSWAGDHEYRMPWRTMTADGGTRTVGARAGNAWYEYSTLTNEISSPNILACPSDSGVTPASDWNSLVNFSRQNAISYSLFIDTDAYLFGSGPTDILSADRNLRVDPGISSCSSGINAANRINFPISNSAAAWTNSVHSSSGHVLRFDGATEFTDTARLRELLSASRNDGGDAHILRAR